MTPARFLKCLETATGKTEFLQNNLPRNASQRLKDDLQTGATALSGREFNAALADGRAALARTQTGGKP